LAKKKQEIFETERLLFRPTTEIDAAFILELVNTPKWIKNIGDRKVHSVDDAKNYIKTKMIPQFEKLGYSNYTVIRKGDKIKLGTCGLYNRYGIDGVDVGFAFLPQYEKKGYAFECTSKLLQVAIDDFKIKKISAITIKENIASQKLLEKLGLEFKKEVKIPSDDEELLLYELNIE